MKEVLTRQQLTVSLATCIWWRHGSLVSRPEGKFVVKFQYELVTQTGPEKHCVHFAGSGGDVSVRVQWPVPGNQNGPMRSFVDPTPPPNWIKYLLNAPSLLELST